MKKVVILRKIEVKTKCFILPFFKNFSLILSREKRVVIRAIRKKLRKQSFADILQNRFRKKISQISQESTFVEVSLNKDAGLRACNFIKKRLQHRCFPVKFA